MQPLLLTVALAGVLALMAGGPAGTTSTSARIVWDESTLVRVQSGTYGRMVRLRGGRILCGYESGGKSWVCHSRDNGRTWDAPVLVKALPYGAAANPELLQLRSGRVLLFYNQRPSDGIHPFAIGYCSSDDGGRTWRAAERLVFTAGTRPQEGCWEPAAVQLPSGEIQLFFANELPYPDSDDQEITLLRSLDEGATWSAPRTVSYRAGHRDGMPVPLVLKGGKGIAVAIEDSGLAPGSLLQPAIVFTSRRSNWRQPSAGGGSRQRWGALQTPLAPSVYAGAPYLRQFPSGETVLSCQSTEGGRQKPQMVVYVGDANARGFAGRSVPFTIPSDVGGMWNSLFIKDARTVTAVSETIVKGIHGLWAIDGRLIRSGEDGPAATSSRPPRGAPS